MSITRDEVGYAYRLLLGRMPEDEAAFEYGLAAGSLEVLRRWILDGPEFVRALKRDTPVQLRRLVLQEVRQRAVLERRHARPGKAPRIVFLHIMKTAGTSLRTRLEEALPGAPIWRREEFGRPGDAAPKTLAPYRAFMGHFTFADAWHVPAPKRVFTVLREPRARILSLYNFLARHRAEAVAAQPLRLAGIARAGTLLEFLRHRDPEIRASVQNHITCTLAGDYRPVGPNRYALPWQEATAAINGAALLRIALNNLASLDFVTTAERLEEDRPRLMQVLDLPDTGPFPLENTQTLVNDLLEPRTAPEPGPEEQTVLFRLTELDRMLYRLVQLDKG